MVLSVLLIILSLAGCLTDNKLEGTWQTKTNMVDEFNAVMGDDDYDDTLEKYYPMEYVKVK